MAYTQYVFISFLSIIDYSIYNYNKDEIKQWWWRKKWEGLERWWYIKKLEYNWKKKSETARKNTLKRYWYYYYNNYQSQFDHGFDNWSKLESLLPKNERQSSQPNFNLYILYEFL